MVGTALVDERDVAISGLIDIHRVVEQLVEVAVQCCATGLVDNRLVVIARLADAGAQVEVGDEARLVEFRAVAGYVLADVGNGGFARLEDSGDVAAVPLIEYGDVRTRALSAARSVNPP